MPKKISDFTSIESPSDDAIVYVVDSMEDTVDRKWSLTSILAWVRAKFASTPVAVDEGGTGSTSAGDARTALGLDGDSNTTHYHDGRYYTETELDAGQLDGRYLLESNNLSDLDSAATARTNLGLGSAALEDATAFAPALSVEAESADYTVPNGSHRVIINITAGATDRTVTLPDGGSASAGDEIEVYKVDDGSGKVTISRAGSDTIEGNTSVALPSQYNNARIRWNGSYWSIESIKANYDTGEVSIPNWRNQTISITHNLGVRASDLLIEFWGQTSEDTGGDFVKLGTVSFDGGDDDYRQIGFSIYEVDNDSCIIRTPDRGPYVVEPDNNTGTLGGHSGEYRVVARRVH